ncbi:transcriptional regulator sigma L-dependent PAS [Alkalihalophilus pseudofirmus OF4]|uniref:Transcriptional regulator sigma L-dependent PAS n=1 Tax=Alkalihalophilus pseudofirmus (strain ATCC BAA-2126 / JCM 17055 / OF4) TaxID=398511 RepID=D3FUS9_ALKPO|nr:sigma-54-dependent Fis family transcriptional regulator [Alkalihalophilus pseudofirmus]ADC48355.1 transcriptional regulator sigma L-dependent PAS [Alkalihalophilus pseudofirmus OF4]
MKNVLLIGAGIGGTALLQMLLDMEHIEVQAVIDVDLKAKGIELAKRHHIKTNSNWKEYYTEDIDIVFEATGRKDVLESLQAHIKEGTTIVPSRIARLFFTLIEEKDFLIQKLNQHSSIQETILNSTHDGMIAVNAESQVLFFNKAASKMSGIKSEDAIGVHIQEVLPNSGLPRVIQTKKEEHNKKQHFENGTTILTTRVPMFEEDKCIGGLAIFKDVTEIVEMAEQVTNLKSIQTMLEAIIHSSDDAISVVDEHGNGIMINPAYSRLTGLKKEEVINQPATADISEGESMHLRVLETRKAVRGVPLKVGPSKRDVIVNVAPVIVDGQIKGSVGVLHDVSEIKSLNKELKQAKRLLESLKAKYSFDEIVGSSQEMQVAIEQAKIAASTPVTILLRGESGTGKELFAHAIHNESNRRHYPFIRVNCAALSETLLESELFGYEEGAFSGARRGGKKGLFEEAEQGSIFLDEIGELSSNMQAKLLRVLQEKEIVRVGGTKAISIDVRVIAATNVHLERAIVEKEFREDLYYRLNKMPIYIPPLRERINDLSQLAKHLLMKLNEDYGRYVHGLTEDALNYLKTYHWPGNVRELENVLARAMIYMEAGSTKITKQHLPILTEETPQISSNQPAFRDEHKTLQELMEEYERSVIMKSIEECAGNKTAAAKRLNISIRSLYYKLDKMDID